MTLLAPAVAATGRTTTFRFDVTCPRCDGPLDVVDVTEPTARTRTAALTCAVCGDDWEVFVTLRSAGARPTRDP